MAAELPTPAKPMPKPWRWDSFTWTLLILGGLNLIALGFYTPLSHSANPYGPPGDTLARYFYDAIGFGIFTLYMGGLFCLAMYITRRSWLKIGLRTLGWTLLTISTIVALDRWGQLSPVSAFGNGGALGAFLRSTLDREFAAPLPITLWVVGTIFALILVFTTMMIRLFKNTGHAIQTTVHRLANLYTRLTTPKIPPVVYHPPIGEMVTLEKVEPVVAKPAQKPVPIDGIPITHAEVLAPNYEYDDVPTPDEPIPIHKHSQYKEPEPEPVEEFADVSEGYELPPVSLLSDPDPFPVTDHAQKLRDRALLLEKTFTDFGLAIKVVGIHTGPVITQYEISLETGLRLNKVTVLSDDLALCLGVSSVRIVAPLPGRNTVGIEVPNEHRQTVRLKELILATTAKAAKLKLPLFLGKDVEGRPLVYDMASMPHLLIAGRTGTGKSVCLNAVIQSFLFTRSPLECRLILIDPKKVEFSDYARIPHLMHPVVTDDKKAEAILAWAVEKMEERYELLRRARVRNIASYNELGKDEIMRRVDPQNEEERKQTPAHMPYIVVVVDEVGDLLMSMKKEVETHIIRLAQKSRAAGIHLILATQKPTVDVITGLIKSNLPARICFQVASRADSMVVLDEKGADKLLGMGDMLFLQPGTSSIIRGQGTYVEDKEIERVMAELALYEPNFESELMNLKTRETTEGGNLGQNLRDRDPMYEQAIEIVIREQRGSTSLLQRALGIGYGRASRLIDFMAEDGIVGGFNGSNAREVLFTMDDWHARNTGD